MLIALGIIILIFLLIVPGFIAEWLFRFISRFRATNFLIGALIFDLFIFLQNIIGLYIFNDVYTVQDLYEHFNCLHFCTLYGLLSIFTAIVLGIIYGIIGRIVFRKCRIIDN